MGLDKYSGYEIVFDVKLVPNDVQVKRAKRGLKMIRYVVNLDRSTDRWERASRIFKNLNIDIERISAVDGRKMSQLELQALRPEFKDRHFWLKEMTPGEIGCYLSHIKAWETFLKTNEKWALIMEDDMELYENAKDFILEDSWIPEGVGLIQMTARNPSGADICEKDSIEIVGKQAKLWSGILWNSMGTVSYLINRETAQRCLEISKKIIGPVDDILFLYASPLRQTTKAWGIAPAVFYFEDETESVIGVDKKNNRTPMMKSPKAYLERKWIMMKNKLRAKMFGVKVVR